MAIPADQNQDVPMSVRMQRVLDAVKRMSLRERVQLLVKAGLVEESEVEQAVARVTVAREARRGSKSREGKPAKKATRQRKT